MTGLLIVLSAVLGVVALGVWLIDAVEVHNRRQVEAAKRRHPCSRGSER